MHVGDPADKATRKNATPQSTDEDQVPIISSHDPGTEVSEAITKVADHIAGTKETTTKVKQTNQVTEASSGTVVVHNMHTDHTAEAGAKALQPITIPTPAKTV